MTGWFGRKTVTVALTLYTHTHETRFVASELRIDSAKTTQKRLQLLESVTKRNENDGRIQK